MWPSSWECLSPDTCVRCANVTDDTCLYNKFTCSCNYKGDNKTCVHQEIIDIHKSKINASQSNINISLPGTSGISTLNLKSKRRTKRKKKEKYKKEHIEPDYSDAAISETTNLLSPGNFLSPEGGDVNERERFLPSSKEKCHRDYLGKRITDESSSDSSNTSSCSSSSDSSSSSSSSSDSSSSNSSSCDESTKVTETTYKGYQIMKVNEDCDNSDYEDDSESNSSSSESADSTSASSDNSWWQEYKQLKEIQFFKKPNPDAMKDSGYVSTTSPNDSNIVDE